MSTLTSRPRPRSQRLQRLTSPETQRMTEQNIKIKMDDWKLRPNVQLKVALKKLSENFPGIPPNRNISIVTVKSKSKVHKDKTPQTMTILKRTSASTSKNICDELRDLLPRCDPNCKHCEEYILQLTHHIQSTHNPQECDEAADQFFHSLISSVPEQNDQESPQVPETLGDLDMDPSLTLTQDSNSDSQSESRTLVIRNTKVIYYVEELSENELGQIQIPLTSESEGQPSTSTSTTLQNCLKNDSTQIEFVHFRNDKKETVQKNSEKIKNKCLHSKINVDKQVETLEDRMDVDVDPLTFIGDQNSDSDPEDADNNNDSDPDFVVEKNDSDSNPEIEIDDENQNQFEKYEEIKNLTETNIFSCEICDRTFSRKAYLQRHIVRAHATTKPFTCQICKRNYASQQLLTEHKRVHAGGKHYSCETCGKNYSDPEELKVHSNTHSDTTGENLFKCDQCDKSFKEKKNLQDHKICHGEKSFVCKIGNCGKGFKRNTHLKIHMRKIHTAGKKIHTGGKSYKCETCEKTYDVPYKLAKHKKSHTGERPFKCTECDATFARSDILSSHMETHGEKSQICEICGKRFHRKSLVKKHILRIHGEISKIAPKLYKCDTCEKSYDAPGLLDVHKRTHTGEKPFMCEFCSMCFIGSKALAGHVMIHKEKLHTCDHCGKAFHRRRKLIEHVKLHTRENPYKCEDCQESFLLPKQLSLHQRIHTGEKVYKCEVEGCGKYFPVMKQLTVHQKCHTEERGFQCTECPKSFKIKTHLRTHFKIHTGIKAYKCDECGKCFTLPSELRSHQKRKSKCAPQEPEPVQVLGI